MKKKGSRVRYYRLATLLVSILLFLAMLMLSKPVVAAPLVTLDPTFGACGTKVIINGTVFESYKGDEIYIYFNENEIAGSPLTVPETGTFGIQFTIPDNISPGTYQVGVKSEVGTTKLIAEASFQVEPVALSLNVIRGEVGTDVVVSGCGFYAERSVTLYFDNMSTGKIGTAAASSTGRFNHSFVIPDSTGGNHRVIAVNDKGNTAEATFTVNSVINPGVDSAGSGQLINIRGTSFGYQSIVDITLGNHQAAIAIADDYGNFNIDLIIPDVRSGTYDLKAQDNMGNIDSARFTVTAGASLSQTTGFVGSDVTIRGDGFAAGESVTITYDTEPVATTKVDNNGAFTVTFDIPQSTGGSHTITLSDGTTTRQYDFNVESEAPPVPLPLLPVTDSESRAQARLNWLEVSDVSQPVTYGLQLSLDANFGSLILEKKGLTESEYNLTSAEALHTNSSQTTFFWRVNAMDAARNTSEWSNAWSFFISAPPTPELLTPSFNRTIELPLLFTWRPVYNLSGPMEYSLQVSQDPDFMPTQLEKTGLPVPEYAVTDEDRLELKKGKDYYWRVKAIDKAGNESDWSVPGTFNRGSSFHFPGWLTATLIIIGVIAVGFLAFRAGRRSAYRIPDLTLY